MISLTFPKENENYYINAFETMIGPVGPDMSHQGEHVSYTPSYEKMSEVRGKYHENSVSHDKMSGTFEYLPLLANGSLTKYPSASAPDQIRVVLSRDGVNYTCTVKHGYMAEYHTSMYLYGSGSTLTYYVHREYFTAANGNKCFYEILGDLRTPGSISNYYLYEIVSVVPSGTRSCILKYRMDTYGDINPVRTTIQTTYDFSKPLTYGVIASIPRALRIGNRPLSTLYPAVYQDKVPYKLNVLTMIEFVDVFMMQYWPGMFPIKDMHYGNLAFEAAKKVPANNVNMLSFLSDLKNPKSLIPKLKNFRNPKILADNYLSVKYGILPTVSDLQDIYKAIVKRKPVHDRNGFSTYSSGHVAHLDDGLSHYDLEQHIKLAIGDEDCALDALSELLDNIGLAPTLENLWDLVPYSFIADWFARVGDLLERVDTRLYLQQYNIRYVTSSRKSTIRRIKPASSLSPLSGTLTWVRYHRWVSDQCPLPPLSLELNSQGHSHWLESVALIVQRTRK